MTRHPGKLAYTFFAGETELAVRTYAEIDRRARAIAAHLIDQGLAGERVLLLYAPGMEFIEAFLGCLYSGVVAVPAYPPDPARLARSLPRFRAIVEDADARAALSVAPILAMFRAAISAAPDLERLRTIATDLVDDAAADAWRRPELDARSLAFLQYTSGSTSVPKGVTVSHENIVTNEQIIQSAFRHHHESTILGWLPFYHDMGLIGNILQPVFLGTSCYLMSPLEFLQRPLNWLRAIGRYRAETSGGPNFAYDLCVRKLAAEPTFSADLSSWQVAFNGAEPIRAESLDRFAAAFAPYGFDRRAFFPCYGLAESTLFVTGAQRGGGATIAAFDAQALGQGRVVAAVDDPHARTLVGCGATFGDHECLVVDDQGEIAPPGAVGEIWVHGKSVVAGYWRRAEDSHETFGARLANGDPRSWLRTGDLGFLRDGELFVTGRAKDLIIIRGRNHYPHDLEATVQRAHASLRPGCCAAFSVEVQDEEVLVVAQEIATGFTGDATDVLAAIRRAIAQEHELQVHAVVLLRQGTLGKTSSGKIQRRACREGFLAGTLEVVARSVLGDDAARRDAATAAAPASTAPAATAASAATPAHVAIRAAIARALRIAEADLDPARPLVEHGLDSLAAIELQQDLEDQLGIALAITDPLGETPLATVITTLAQAAATSPRAPALAPETSQPDEFPLSHGQRALWYLQRLAPESAAYNIAVALELRPAPDAAALAHAFTALCARHAALRTVFATRDGDVVQRATAPGAFPLATEDAATWSDAELAAQLAAEAERPFDLETGPILRARLLGRPASAILQLVVHHIVADFWSLETIAAELQELYEAARVSRTPRLPATAASYDRFVRWQAAHLAGPEAEAHRRYWSERLAGAPAALALPVDRPRPAEARHRGAAVAFALAPELDRGIRALAEREATTVFVVLLAAYQVFLSRRAMQDDLVVGVPVAGRPRKDLAGVVGYCVNSLPLRAELGDDPSFRTLLARTRTAVLGALAHQDLPLPVLVEAVRPPREPGRPPLFQAMFSLQKARHPAARELAAAALGARAGEVAWESLSIAGYPLERRTTQFDLALELADLGDRLAGSLEYDRDLFEPATAARMVDELQHLLAAAVAEPDTAVRALPLEALETARARLAAWGTCDVAYPAADSVLALIARHVGERPDAPAVVSGDATLTYAQLAARAAGLADRLRAAGVTAGDAVALQLRREPELVVAILGTVLAGAAYVPIDVGTPARRLAHVVTDARARVLITDGAADELQMPDLQVLAVDGATEPVAVFLTAAAAIAPEARAYVIYTSGTSGSPKGVEILHRNLLHYTHAACDVYALTPDDRVLQFASVAFDTSVEEIFVTLAAGATLVLRDDEMLHAPAHFLARCGELGITILDLPTAYWSELVTAASAADWRAAAAVRLVVVGGEKATLDRVAAWHERAPAGVRLVNSYGPTEATVAVTLADLSALGPTELAAMTEVSIGRPLPNCRVYVLDRDARPVPIGVPGELYLGGAGVARGYLGAPELTATRFVPDPFSPEPGARMYRSGDKARWLADGTLQFLGRIDHQVKIRGYRVELGEIETVLAAFPAVRAAVVALAADGNVVAYLEHPDRTAISLEALRGFLKERLPAYMLPARFVVVAALPMSTSGKVDRSKLPAPSADNLLEHHDEVPRGAAEERMAAVWKRVLKLERVGLHENFFDLGGHSLLLPVLLGEIRKEFERDIPMVKLLEHPTIAASAALFTADGQDDHGDLARSRDRAALIRARTHQRRPR